MPETIQSFLNKVKDAAVELGEPATVDLITAVSNQTGNSKMRILIVGSTGSGRFSLVNVLLGQPNLLPTSPIPKAPISVDISYGGTSTVEIAAKNGVNTATLPDKLRTFLTSPDTDATKYLGIKVETSCDLLKTSQIRIESIGARRAVSEWKELLAGTDYTILVLKAVALLSEQERQFFRDFLTPSFGLERVAIVINQMDLVPEDERASISELVRSFLGSFESQPLLIELSATHASKGMKSNSTLPDSGYEALMSLVKVDLVEKHSLLKSATMRQAAEICLSEVADGVTCQNALLELSEADCKELLGQISSENQWLQTRVQRTQHGIDLFINTLIKEEFLRETEGFSDALRQQLPDEVMPVEDIAAIRRHLPGYLEAVWAEFFNSQQASIRGKLTSEMKRIGETVEADLKELLGNKSINVEELLSSFDPTPASRKIFLMPKRSSSQIGTLATGLQLSGFLLIAQPQLLPLALVSIGAGQVICMTYKKNMEASEKKVIISSTISTTHELERQIKKQVEAQFEALTGELNESIADLYAQGIAEIRSVLENGLELHKELKVKKEQLGQLADVTLPELRKLLDQVCGQDVPV